MTTLVTFVFLKMYKDSLVYAILFSTPLIVIVITLPDYFRFLYFAIIGRPALVLTKDLLINNVRGKAYKWADIKEIAYKRFTGFKAPSGGYIEVVLCNSEDKIQLPNNSIKCKTQDLLKDLQYYLNFSKTVNKL